MNPSNSTGFSLGQLSAQAQNGTAPNNSFSFGQSPGAGFSFGSSTQPTATATVNPLTSSSGFSFGASTSAGNFNFGQSAPAATTAASGFGFLQPSSSTTTTGSLNFGQNTAAPPSGGLNFNQNSTIPSGGLNFGQSPATPSSGINFGQSSATPSGGINFGQSSATPSSGLSFGQNAAVSSSGLNFGQNTATPSGGLNFGQPAPATSAGFSFGQTNPTSSASTFSGFGFAQNNPVSSASLAGFSLGQTTPSTSSGLNFGMNMGNVSAGQPASAGFNFAQPAIANTSNAASSGLFGQSSIANTTTSTSGLFGQPVTNAIPAASSASPFGQASTSIPTTTTTLFNQSTTSTPSGLFGLTSSSSTQPTSGLNFGAGGSGGLFGPPSNAPTSTGVNFGTPASSSGFNFPASSSTSTGFALPSSSGGLGGTSPSIFSSSGTTTPSLGLGGSLPTSSTISTSGGLGGFQTSSIDSGIGNNMSKGDGKSAKEAPLPQDIFATIAVFEGYKDMEKKCSEDNIRQTATPFHKLVEDTRKLRQHIVKLSHQNNQLHSSAQKLKSSVIQEAENVEMARRTQDTPMNLQGDNKAPEQFFLRLVRSFEERMTFCRNRIEEVEKCARSNGNGSEITSDDMKEVLKKEHDMVKALAAKIYTLHNQLINYTNHSNNPEMQPEVLFKPPSADQQETIGFSNKQTTILRPALGEGGSGLLNFQNGQQKAKALSLGAAPPTLPLSQTALNPLGSVNDTNIFSGSSAPIGSSMFNFNSSLTPNNNNNSLGNSFSFNKPAFGSNGSSSSLFGTPSTNLNQSGGLFGAGNNASLFGNAKSFKK